MYKEKEINCIDMNESITNKILDYYYNTGYNILINKNQVGGATLIPNEETILQDLYLLRFYQDQYLKLLKDFNRKENMSYEDAISVFRLDEMEPLSIVELNELLYRDVETIDRLDAYQLIYDTINQMDSNIKKTYGEGVEQLRRKDYGAEYNSFSTEKQTNIINTKDKYLLSDLNRQLFEGKTTDEMDCIIANIIDLDKTINVEGVHAALFDQIKSIKTNLNKIVNKNKPGFLSKLLFSETKDYNKLKKMIQILEEKLLQEKNYIVESDSYEMYDRLFTDDEESPFYSLQQLSSNELLTAIQNTVYGIDSVPKLDRFLPIKTPIPLIKHEIKITRNGENNFSIDKINFVVKDEDFIDFFKENNKECIEIINRMFVNINQPKDKDVYNLPIKSKDIQSIQSLIIRLKSSNLPKTQGIKPKGFEPKKKSINHILPTIMHETTDLTTNNEIDKLKRIMTISISKCEKQNTLLTTARAEQQEIIRRAQDTLRNYATTNIEEEIKIEHSKMIAKITLVEEYNKYIKTEYAFNRESYVFHNKHIYRIYELVKNILININKVNLDVLFENLKEYQHEYLEQISNEIKNISILERLLDKINQIEDEYIIYYYGLNKYMIPSIDNINYIKPDNIYNRHELIQLLSTDIIKRRSSINVLKYYIKYHTSLIVVHVPVNVLITCCYVLFDSFDKNWTNLPIYKQYKYIKNKIYVEQEIEEEIEAPTDTTLATIQSFNKYTPDIIQEMIIQSRTNIAKLNRILVGVKIINKLVSYTGEERSIYIEKLLTDFYFDINRSRSFISSLESYRYLGQIQILYIRNSYTVIALNNLESIDVINTNSDICQISTIEGLINTITRDTSNKELDIDRIEIPHIQEIRDNLNRLYISNTK